MHMGWTNTSTQHMVWRRKPSQRYTHNSYCTTPGSISLYTPIQIQIPTAAENQLQREGNERLSRKHAVLPTLLHQHNKRWTRAFSLNRYLICMTFNLYCKKKKTNYRIYQNEITKWWNKNGWMRNILLLIGQSICSHTLIFNVIFDTVFIHFLI